MPIWSCPTEVAKPLRTLLAPRDKSYRPLASRGSAGNYRMEKEYLGSVADSPSKCLVRQPSSFHHLTKQQSKNSTYMPRIRSAKGNALSPRSYYRA